jgi:hypothetical protein
MNTRRKYLIISGSLVILSRGAGTRIITGPLIHSAIDCAIGHMYSSTSDLLKY